jgi:glucose-1-phosphate cytidylyltransferase
MKVVILAGGLGTRLSEETYLKPKPMVEIGGKPILWHIMKIYSHYGINDFIICCGYKGNIIKNYFANYLALDADFTIDISENKIKFHSNSGEPWKISLVDTGDSTMTGGRLLRVANYLYGSGDFCFTYGDGVGDINIKKALEFHKSHKKLATMTVASPPNRFGSVTLEGNTVSKFKEKPKDKLGLVNAGFFVLKEEAIKYIKDDQTSWELEPLNALSDDRQLMAHVHGGFWKPMDTINDKNILESMWNSGQAPWKIW